jgi:hypothetical protein
VIPLSEKPSFISMRLGPHWTISVMSSPFSLHAKHFKESGA